MLITRTNDNGSRTIEDERHPFIRFPQSQITSDFQGWGPRI